MEKNSNKPLDEGHDGPPQDETTKNKIEKHLSDINDTISEDDLKNINTNTGATPPTGHVHDKEEADEILKEKPDEDDTDKEAPSAWEILDNN